MIRVHADREALAEGAARLFADSARRAAAERGRFTVALAGGSTPAPLYRRLTRGEGSAGLEVQWHRVHLFWGDERMAPPQDEASNFRMVELELLEHVPVPPGNVHPIDTGLGSAEEAAKAYEAEIRDFFQESEVIGQLPPRFDLVLLGLGEDGHTASLFPGCPAVEERFRWVAACELDRLDHPRVTLTRPILERGRRVVFLVSGAGKADVLRRVLDGDRELPAARLRPREGEPWWLVDEAAASSLEKAHEEGTREP